MSQRRKRRTAKTVAFVILAVVIFSLLIFALYKIDFMEVLEFIPSIFEKDEDTSTPDHSDKIKEIMELLGGDDVVYEKVNSDAETVISMLAAAQTVQDYYHVYTVKYSSGDDLLTKNLYVTKNADAWKILVRDSNSSLKTVRFDGKQYAVKDEATGEEKIFSADSGMSFETQTYLTPISEIRSLLVEYESSLNAGRTAARISGCEAELVRSQSANIVSLRFRYDSTGQVEEYMIHLDYGVLISARSELDGKIYYEVTTSVFEPNTAMKP